jgi:ceramide glucosyltransferase
MVTVWLWLLLVFWSLHHETKQPCIISAFRKWKLHRKVSKLPSETPYPGVSILKPLMGVDPNLFTNLETFFTMNYPVVSVVVRFVCALLFET